MYSLPSKSNVVGSSTTVVAGVIDGRKAFDRVVKRRGVNEGLEYRAGLAPGQNVIELALAVVASADDGANLPGVRIERHDGHLRLARAGPSFFQRA